MVVIVRSRVIIIKLRVGSGVVVWLMCVMVLIFFGVLWMFGRLRRMCGVL